MEDQDRVVEIPKDFNQEKRPSQSSEEISWTFLDGRKSAENSPKPPKPKIVVNSHLLSPPDYDAEPEMSDGISVISEGEGHNTPPESDTAAATPDAIGDDNQAAAHVEAGTLKGGRFNFDTVRMTRRGYRPLTPPQTPPSDNEEDAAAKDLAVVPQKKKALDLESIPVQSAKERRFIGIYPRHVVFLMVVCGIVGGMIGHLWNVNFGCHCGEKANDHLTTLYDKMVSENLILQEQLHSCSAKQEAGRTTMPPTTQPTQTKPTPTQRSKEYTGHEKDDKFVRVQPETTTHRFIPEDEFESLIWKHLKETEEKHRREEEGGDVPDMFPDQKSKQASHHDNRNGKYKRAVPTEEEGERRRNNRYGDSDENSGDDDSHERKDKWRRKEYKQGSGAEKYQKYKLASSKEATNKYENKQKQGKFQQDNKRHGGSGDGGGRRKERSGEDSREKARDFDRKYDKKYHEQQQQQNYRKKERASGEWSDKRNKGRDEMRQQKQSGEKNWYLERGSDREINRAETASPTMAM